VLGRAVQHLLSSICFCVKTFIWEEGGNVQSTFINFECVQKRARIWLTNFLHDTNTVHWEDKEHSTTVLGRAVQYLLSPIRYCVETCIWGGGGAMVNLSLIQQAGPESWTVTRLHLLAI
jgi:hypothetical protein